LLRKIQAIGEGDEKARDARVEGEAGEKARDEGERLAICPGLSCM
jgi:hypothetical protein